MVEYTPEMRRAVSKFKIPHGVMVYVVKYSDRLALRVDKTTFHDVPLPQQMDIAKAIYELKDILESFDIVCDVEGLPKWS